MKKRILGMVAVVAIVAAVAVGCTGTDPAQDESQTGDLTPTAIVSSGVDNPAGSDPADNLSRGYIDVDLSGDFSEGDIDLTPDGEGGYYVPVQ